VPLLIHEGQIIGPQSLVTDHTPLWGTDAGGAGGNLLLLESGSPDNLLLENGDDLLLES
jgi:hypothetical protein